MTTVSSVEPRRPGRCRRERDSPIARARNSPAERGELGGNTLLPSLCRMDRSPLSRKPVSLCMHIVNRTCTVYHIECTTIPNVRVIPRLEHLTLDRARRRGTPRMRAPLALVAS